MCYNGTESGVVMTNNEIGPYDAAIITNPELNAKIAEYEKQFGMTSKEFWDAWHIDGFPDTWEGMNWNILLTYRRKEIG